MSDARSRIATEPVLYFLLVGSSHELEMLRFKLRSHASVAQVDQVAHTHHMWGEVRSGTVNAVIIDLAAPHDDIDSIVLSVFRMREEFPEIVFAFLADSNEFTAKTAVLSPEVSRRLGHYYRLPRSLPDDEVGRLVSQFERWHSDHIANRPNTQRYKYDVALSFAGEDREYADRLARILRAQGVRVFYDDFEQADLWGKNLFEHLFAVYAEQSRYCILFVSRAYASKMWTVHERRAAQERVLKSRHDEYLLPVRIDDTRLPGLPDTVAYMNVGRGIESIANLFVRKLGAVVGTFS